MSSKKEISDFNALKKLVVQRFRENHQEVSEVPQNWSGQDITFFQEDIQDKLHTSISEKWFYTYFKQNEVEKLPRIDMLNMLAAYAGKENWQNFQNEQVKQGKDKGKNAILLIGIVLLMIAILVYVFIPNEKSYSFCFVDKDVDLPITSTLQIMVLQAGESPVYLESEENGCFTYRTKASQVQFVVESPYYNTDTITRYYKDKNGIENVHLKADEYALILHYFSTNNVDDWNQRRKELGKIIADDAVIYQVFGEEVFGIDVLTKEAFINRMTLPTSSLRNLKILEIVKERGKITKLKFAVNHAYE